MSVISKGAPPRVAIIGTGVAGITCAKHLARAGAMVVVFEKSRGLGGRLATRRTANGLRFDHGAQYITARSQSFRALIDEAAENDTARIWAPRLGCEDERSGERWFVGAPTMNAFLKSDAASLDIRLEHTVKAVRRENCAFLVDADPFVDDNAFDIVVSAAPAPQAAALAAAAAPDAAARLNQVEMAPCWAAMVGFEKPYNPGFDMRRWEQGDLAWFARNGSKPGRDVAADCWVAHAGAAWSALHLEEQKTAVLDQLLMMLRDVLPMPMPGVAYADVHRWRYARTAAPAGTAFIADKTGCFFAIGDWCLGARVECAFESGHAAAGEILNRFL